MTAETIKTPIIPDADREAELELADELVAHYDNFKDDIERLLGDARARQPHDSGSFSEVYLLNREDGEYVVRTPRVRLETELQKHLAAAVRIGHIPHIEHIVAADYKTGITVARRAEGQSVDFITSAEINAITKEQIADLFDSMSTAYRLGVGFDPSTGNLLYDEEMGFTVLDLGVIGDERLHDPDSASTPARALESFFDHIGSDVIEDWNDKDEQAKITAEKKLMDVFYDYYHPERPGPETDDLSKAMTLLQSRLIEWDRS